MFKIDNAIQTNPRFKTLEAWAAQVLPTPIISTLALPADASFRRYYRFYTENTNYLVMDAPPEKENVSSFVNVAQRFAAAELPVPKLYAIDSEQGFVLLEDFGNCLFSYALKMNDPTVLYQKAFDSLVTLQKISQDSPFHFPNFDRTDYLRELTHCQEWFLEKHLGLKFTDDEQAQLNTTFEFLIKSALEQPQVCVHRDYHSRNLMLKPDFSLGILDFQDAVWGPITYDLVSLLRDCYVDWPLEQVEAWVNTFYKQSQQAGIIQEFTFADYLRGFDLAGLQRHLKCMFIFARKFHRDGTRAYLGDIPRIMNYSLHVSKRYAETQWLHQFFLNRILPAWEQLA